ncbi:hypothetical protein [Cystobacter fuscus]|uniref:hypothetical protein n=1 Tax=Cystobacter fuscus TaxID=43 RepID=UPI0005B8A0B0|nr:hypothetical protein [Cystobacter fuscus]
MTEYQQTNEPVGEVTEIKEIGDHAVEFAKDTHANLQDMIKVADAKATSFVALQALVLVILGSSLGQDITKSIRDGGSSALVLVVFGALVLLSTSLSTGLCLLVLLPRSPKHIRAPAGARGLLWIDAINGGQVTPDSYLAALMRTGPRERLADLAFENLKIAWILRRKFYFLSKAAPVVAISFITWSLLIVVAVIAPPSSVVAQ